MTISDTLVSDTGGGGILFGSDNSAVRIANTNLTDTGILSDGIAFLDGNRNVTISGVGIIGAGFHGISSTTATAT